jgi:hypothetical protein
MQTAPTKIPTAAVPKMPPADLVGRLMATEALLLVLMEAYLDRDDVSEEKGKALIRNIRESAKLIAEQLGHPDVLIAVDKAVDNLIDVLTTNLPSMRGEFGRPGPARPARRGSTTQG